MTSFEYTCAAILLNESDTEINEDNIVSVLQSAGHDPSNSRAKAVVAALEGVNVDSISPKPTDPGELVNDTSDEGTDDDADAEPASTDESSEDSVDEEDSTDSADSEEEGDEVDDTDEDSSDNDTSDEGDEDEVDEDDFDFDDDEDDEDGDDSGGLL